MTESHTSYASEQELEELRKEIRQLRENQTSTTGNGHKAPAPPEEESKEKKGGGKGDAWKDSTYSLRSPVSGPLLIFCLRSSLFLSNWVASYQNLANLQWLISFRQGYLETGR